MLADQGICCIDEFDKMGKPSFRNQSISPSRPVAGIAREGSRALACIGATPKSAPCDMTKDIDERWGTRGGGPHGDPRGHGAADGLDCQGRHHDIPQCAFVSARCRQSPIRVIQMCACAAFVSTMLQVLLSCDCARAWG